MNQSHGYAVNVVKLASGLYVLDYVTGGGMSAVGMGKTVGSAVESARKVMRDRGQSQATKARDKYEFVAPKQVS